MQKLSSLIKINSLIASAILCGAKSLATLPVLIGQPQSATVPEGNNVTFTVEASNPQSVLPQVTSATLQLWLKADAGVVAGDSNGVSQWQDLSGLTNHCSQTNLNRQPLLVPNGFNGRPVIRFDGIQDVNVGDYLQGFADVGLTAGFSSFLVYSKANRTVPEEVPVLIGVPGLTNSVSAVRTCYIRSLAGISNEMAFSGWANDYGSSFRIPPATPRIWTERLSTSKTLIEFFDTDGVTNFSSARTTSGLLSPTNGYYVGGLGSQTRNFKGDIAEIIYFKGALSNADRIAVEGYLRQKYFTSLDINVIHYQWRFNGTNIVGATNSSLTLNHVQWMNAGNYSVAASNASGSIMSSNALLTVVPTNRAPVATSQSLSVSEDNALPVELTATDPDGDVLAYIVTAPTNGTLTGAAPNLVYRSSANFHGTDSFTFKVNDGKVDSATATISITVLSVNDAPAAFSQSLSVNEDVSLSVTLAAVDADGDTLSYSVTSPAHGTLTGTVPHLTYTPNPNFYGSDSFSFKVNDGQVDSTGATIITIVSVNDAPVAVATASPSFLFSSNETSTVLIAPCDEAATVILDASQSSDLEKDPLQYFWLEGTNVLGSTQIVSNSFAVGTHSILLSVADGSDSGFAPLILEIITPAEAVAELVLFLENSGLPQNRKQPLMASLNAAVASFARCQIVSGINQLEAFQHKVEAQIAPSSPALAEDMFHISNEIIAAVKSNPTKTKPQK